MLFVNIIPYVHRRSHVPNRVEIGDQYSHIMLRIPFMRNAIFHSIELKMFKTSVNSAEIKRI